MGAAMVITLLRALLRSTHEPPSSPDCPRRGSYSGKLECAAFRRRLQVAVLGNMNRNCSDEAHLASIEQRMRAKDLA